MLILTRRVGESIVIDTFTKITVREVDRDNISFLTVQVDAAGNRLDGQLSRAATVGVGAELEPMEGVTVRVLSLQGRQVRIGITAPKETSIHREEVQARVRAGLPRENKRGVAA